MISPLLVQVENLSKIYDGTAAVQSLSFQVARGEILGILGANGAGKTTTLHILLGLLNPSGGKVSVLGHSPVRERHRLCTRINFSSAYAYLPSNLTVGENLRTFARLYDVKNMDEVIRRLLAQFEVEHLARRITGGLSSGEKTKLNLVKSLLNAPELLVLDEPTASLDPDMADKVRSVLKTLQRERGMGIVYTSHNMHEVETLCDRILFLHHGRKIAEGSSAEIKKAFSAESLDHMFIKIVRGGEIIAEGET